MLTRQQQVFAAALQRGHLKRKRRIDIDDQVAIRGETSHLQRIKPGRQRRLPAIAPGFRQRVFQSGDRQIIQRQTLVAAAPAAVGADHAVGPARAELGQRDALRRQVEIEDRIVKLEASVDKVAGVQRERTVVAAPVVALPGQVFQRQVEIGDRPVRALKARVGHIQTINGDGRQRLNRPQKVRQALSGLQANIVEAKLADQPVALRVALGAAGHRTARQIGADVAEQHAALRYAALNQDVSA